MDNCCIISSVVYPTSKAAEVKLVIAEIRSCVLLQIRKKERRRPLIAPDKTWGGWFERLWIGRRLLVGLKYIPVRIEPSGNLEKWMSRTSASAFDLWCSIDMRGCRLEYTLIRVLAP